MVKIIAQPIGYVRFVPLIIHDVDATFNAVAMPFAASVRLPVLPEPARVSVSDVIAIVTVLMAFTNVRHVPMGYATELFAGMVNVRALLSEPG